MATGGINLGEGQQEHEDKNSTKDSLCQDTDQHQTDSKSQDSPASPKTAEGSLAPTSGDVVAADASVTTSQVAGSDDVSASFSPPASHPVSEETAGSDPAPPSPLLAAAPQPSACTPPPETADSDPAPPSPPPAAVPQPSSSTPPPETAGSPPTPTPAEPAAALTGSCPPSQLATSSAETVDTERARVHLPETVPAPAGSYPPSQPATSSADTVDTERARVQLPEAIPAPAPATAHVSDAAHHIKWVKFHGARSPVITQNVNGPCPLLALINVMLLKGKVQLPPALDVITIGQLMDYVGDTMLDTMPAQTQQPDFEQNMQDAVAILPKLQTGLDVNVKFSGVQEFEYTPECCIFDLLHVRLYHGWLVEPGQTDVQRAVGQCGYNQLVDKIITHKSSADPELAHHALLAENFLENTASQLTAHGLTQLTGTMCDGELAVFFRNNHFSTVYKYQNLLYLLVTDQGFLREPRVVWETLASTDGAGQFVDGEFEPLTPEQPVAASPEQVDQDYLVALSLQEESTRQQAQDMQWEEYKKAEFGSNSEVLSDAELARKLQEEEERGAREQQEQQQQSQPPQPQPAQQQQQQPRQQRLDSSSRSDSRRRNCAIM